MVECGNVCDFGWLIDWNCVFDEVFKDLLKSDLMIVFWEGFLEMIDGLGGLLESIVFLVVSGGLLMFLCCIVDE